jgi:Domain of unknown function (DUF4440)
MDDMQGEIIAADNARCAALIARDMPALKAVLAEEMLHVHTSGVAENRHLYLERIRNGHYVYTAFAVKQRAFRVVGSIVLVDGLIHIDVTTGGVDKKIASRFVQVWTQRDQRWQVLHWHSAPTTRD